MTQILLAGLAGTLVLTIVQGIVANAFPPPLAVDVEGGQFIWFFIGNAVWALVFAAFARAATTRGVRLMVILYGVAVTVLHLTALIEGVAFDVLTSAQAAALLPHSLIPPMFAVPAIVLVARPHRAPDVDVPLTGTHLLRRGVACSVFYATCYFVAGMIIYPWVEHFYATMEIPSPAAVLGLQLFVRGPILVAAVTLLVRNLDGPRSRHALAGAALMAFIGGVVPLVAPNPFFPDAVRWVHFWEVVISNSVFGAVTGWAMSPLGTTVAARIGTERPRHEGLAHGQAK